MKLVFLCAFFFIGATLQAAPVPAQTVERWQKAAMLKYPALTQSGSPLNQRFLAVIAAKRQSDPAFFNQPDWPLRAADAAVEELRTEEIAAKEKEKAEEAKWKSMTKAEREQVIGEQEKAENAVKAEKEWEAQKSRWVFDRLVFGDNEDVIVRKLNGSKLVTSRVSAKMRAELSSRYRWVLGESKFNLDFEMKDGLVAITFDSIPEPTSELDGLIHEDWDKLRTAATEQFGPPTKSTPYPSAPKLRRAGLTVTDVWERPGRMVTLGLTEEDGKCNPNLRVSDPARAKAAPAP